MIEKSSIQWGWVLLIVFLFQVAFFWFSSNKARVSRSISTLEIVRLEDSDILNQMALEDSLSLARPSRRGFPSVWLIPATNEHKLARWVLPDIILPKETNLFESMIADALSRESIPEISVFKRPEPELTPVVVPPLNAFDESRLVATGRLRSRLKAKQQDLRSFWKISTFLKPSRVQILVDPEGKVLSGVLLESSGHQPADQAAMSFAIRQVAFKETTNSILESGDLIFHWHIDPTSITNILEDSP